MRSAAAPSLRASVACLLLAWTGCGDSSMSMNDAGNGAAGTVAGTGGDGVDNEPTATVEELMKPSFCEECHPRQYRDWASSMHAYASEDPVFLAMNQRGQDETGGALGDFCVNCHAPMAVHDGYTTDGLNIETAPEEYRGITCYFCHNVEDVTDTHNNPLVLANDTTMRASLASPVRPSAHKVKYSSFHDRNQHDSGRMCGSCHDIVTPMLGSAGDVHLERTFAEWQEAVFGSAKTLAEGFQSCNHCHMQRYPGVAAEDPDVNIRGRRVTDHLWAAVDTALTPFPDTDVQAKAVACELSNAVILYLVVSPTDIKVRLETQAGHSMPSGASQDRRMWVEVKAFDKNDNLIFSKGDVADDEPVPMDQSDLCVFRDQIFDAEGNEVHMFWEAAKSDAFPEGHRGSTLLSPTMFGVPHTVHCPGENVGYPVNQPSRVTARLHVRPMGFDVLDDLVASGHLSQEVRDAMPTYSLPVLEWSEKKDDFTVEVSGFGTSDDDTGLDCHDEYRCMIDPTSPFCG